MSESPNASIFLARQAKLASAAEQAGLQCVAVNPGPSLTYLTGLHFHLSERPVVVLFAPHQTPLIVLPELEAGKVAGLPYPMQAFTYGEDPRTWLNAFRSALQAAKIDTGKVGIEPRALRVLELRLLEAGAPRAAFLASEEVLTSLRMHKDASEVADMRQAVKIAEQALLATIPAIRAGVTEQAVASELIIQLYKAGSQSPFPFDPIVASGPNSANPHAAVSSRVLQEGDLLIIDWGASYNGYISDLTRTFAIGEVDPELQQIAEVTLQANMAGCAAARPGIPASQVDLVTRQVIEKAGYGQYFIHRTGHGIGMEGHEAPYIYAQNDLILEPGMTFTVEPGIYLPGKGGVRIEDNVVITVAGAEILSTLPRPLQTIGG